MSISLFLIYYRGEDFAAHGLCVFDLRNFPLTWLFGGFMPAMKMTKVQMNQKVADLLRREEGYGI